LKASVLFHSIETLDTVRGPDCVQFEDIMANSQPSVNILS
jgi:hypothetical protein